MNNRRKKRKTRLFHRNQKTIDRLVARAKPMEVILYDDIGFGGFVEISCPKCKRSLSSCHKDDIHLNGMEYCYLCGQGIKLTKDVK